MRFRIGVHSGESLHHAGRLYGDTVNVAARLQAAAAPEGILVSEAVAESVSAYGVCALQELGVAAVGKGTSLQRAEQQAARMVLEKLQA